LSLPEETTKTSLRKSNNRHWLAGALAIMIFAFLGTQFSKEHVHREPLANMGVTSGLPKEQTAPGAGSRVPEVPPENSNVPHLATPPISSLSPPSNKAKESIPKMTASGNTPRKVLAQEKGAMPSNQPQTSPPLAVQPRQGEPKKPDINQPLYGKDAWLTWKIQPKLTKGSRNLQKIIRNESQR
jgi:hypothetical protein